MPAASGDAAPAASPRPASRRYSRYVLALLSLVYVVSFIDRQILAMLIEPIKKEFDVSDTAMGFLTGFAFVIFYTLAGIPVARWADRGSRKFIIAVSLTLWSGLCGPGSAMAGHWIAWWHTPIEDLNT